MPCVDMAVHVHPLNRKSILRRIYPSYQQIYHFSIRTGFIFPPILLIKGRLHRTMRSLRMKILCFYGSVMSMKIYVQQIRRFISIDGYYTHFFNIPYKSARCWIENVNTHLPWRKSFTISPQTDVEGYAWKMYYLEN